MSGTIDGVALVLDLLWFIPGVVPGVVKLIIDFRALVKNNSPSGARCIAAGCVAPPLRTPSTRRRRALPAARLARQLDKLVLISAPTSGTIYVQQRDGSLQRLQDQRLELDVQDGAFPGETQLELATSRGQLIVRQHITANAGRASLDLSPPLRWVRETGERPRRLRLSAFPTGERPLAAVRDPVSPRGLEREPAADPPVRWPRPRIVARR